MHANDLKFDFSICHALFRFMNNKQHVTLPATSRAPPKLIYIIPQSSHNIFGKSNDNYHEYL